MNDEDRKRAQEALDEMHEKDAQKESDDYCDSINEDHIKKLENQIRDLRIGLVNDVLSFLDRTFADYPNVFECKMKIKSLKREIKRIRKY